MPNNLTQTVDLGIQFLNPLFSEKTTATIKKCVEGYSTRDSFSGKIASVAYRIFNAFKSLFGQSDWQRAKKAILNDVANLSPDLSRFKNKLIKPLLEPILDIAFKIIISINNSKIKYIDIQKISEDINQLNLGEKFEELFEKAALPADNSDTEDEEVRHIRLDHKCVKPPLRTTVDPLNTSFSQ